jgi:hypothetical protein
MIKQRKMNVFNDIQWVKRPPEIGRQPPGSEIAQRNRQDRTKRIGTIAKAA